MEEAVDLAKPHEQLIALANTLCSEKAPNDIKNQKFTLLYQLKLDLKTLAITETEITRAAKHLFFLLLQENTRQFRNTTPEGRELEKLLNTPHYNQLSSLLFNKTQNIQYRDIRTFIWGENDSKVFTYANRLTVFHIFNDHKKNPEYILPYISNAIAHRAYPADKTQKWGTVFLLGGCRLAMLSLTAFELFSIPLLMAQSAALLGALCITIGIFLLWKAASKNRPYKETCAKNLKIVTIQNYSPVSAKC